MGLIASRFAQLFKPFKLLLHFRVQFFHRRNKTYEDIPKRSKEHLERNFLEYFFVTLMLWGLLPVCGLKAGLLPQWHVHGPVRGSTSLPIALRAVVV
eukprot:3085360-Amphidinium_carterae.2